MRLTSAMKRGVALVVSAAALVSMAACGQANNGSGDEKAAEQTYKTEPAEGTPVSYNGKLPMPEPGKAYNNPKDRSELKQGGTLTLATTEIGPDWNYLSGNGMTLYMSSFWNLYMPQIWDYSSDGSEATPNPDYVTKAELVSEDPETIKFTINDKAAWNDGTPITWKDFESTWKAQNGQDESFAPSITDGYSQISSVAKGDTDKEAVVTFGTPYYPWQALFQTLYPSEAYAQGADMFNQGWQNNSHCDEWGAGPFKVKSFNDSEAVFVPNEKWWGDKPMLDSITYKQMEPSASINAFKNGEIDATSAGTADRLKQVKTVKDAYLRRAYQNRVSVYNLNSKAKFLSDVNVRKAVVQAIDRKQLAKIDFNGLDWNEDIPGSNIMYLSDSGYEDNMPADAREASADKAKKTMEDAGYTMGDDGYFADKDGNTVSVDYVTFSDDPTIKAGAQATQKMLKDAGIKCDINIKASNDFSDVLGSGDFGIIAMAWSASDPFGYSSSSYQLYGSDSQANYAFAGSADIDAKLKKISQTSDREEGVKMFNEAEKEYMKLYAQIPFENGPTMTVVKKGLANYGPAGYASARPQDIGWEK